MEVENTPAPHSPGFMGKTLADAAVVARQFLLEESCRGRGQFAPFGEMARLAELQQRLLEERARMEEMTRPWRDGWDPVEAERARMDAVIRSSSDHRAAIEAITCQRPELIDFYGRPGVARMSTLDIAAFNAGVDGLIRFQGESWNSFQALSRTVMDSPMIQAAREIEAQLKQSRLAMEWATRIGDTQPYQERRPPEVFIPLRLPRVERVEEKEKHFVYVFWAPIIDATKESVPEEITAGYVFRKTGRIWSLGIPGDIRPVTHKKGLHYIGYALAQPGEWLVHREIFEIFNPADISERSMSDQPKVDAQMMKQVKAERARLSREQAEAQECGLLEKADKIRGQIEALEDRISADLGLRGKYRRFTDRDRKAKEAVVRAIKRALDSLESEHPALHDHLVKYLHLTPLLIYQPDAPVRWEL